MPNSIASDHQSPSPGTAIVLYEFDLTRYDLGVYRFVTGDTGDIVHAVSFGDNIYSPWAIKSEGWDVSSSGSLPRPSIVLADTGNLLTGIIESNNDLLLCPVKRIRTYEKYLDTGDTPNVNETKPIDDFIIIRKTGSTPGKEVRFQLASPLDLEFSYLPGRQIHRDYCPYIYRTFEGGSFDYTEVDECTYEGNNYFDENGDSVSDPALDRCGKCLSDCKARFGDNAVLPYGGYPGVSRTKVQ